MSILDLNHERLTQALLTRLFQSDMKTWLLDYAQPYRELMAYYRCAIMEISTKFQVLNEEFSLQYDRNPIEGVKTRLKSLESVIEKLTRKQLPLSIESIEQNINDIAGVRVICSYPSDIYMLADALLRQDDIELIQKKDYIQNPKPNGYRSLHLIVETPIYLHNQKKPMKVEVQFRTISMDWWASLEHKIRYKKDVVITDQIAQELSDCADMGAQLDLRMEKIQRSLEAAERTKDENGPAPAP